MPTETVTKTDLTETTTTNGSQSTPTEKPYPRAADLYPSPPQHRTKEQQEFHDALVAAMDAVAREREKYGLNNE